MFKVYILLCSDNSLYTGYTKNLPERINTHNSKKGSKYLKGKLPVKLIYFENFETRGEALKREAQIKGWTRQEKLNLIKYKHPNHK